VFPSLREGFPYAVLEAMAFGLPVVATRVGALDEMIGAEGGRLVAPGRVDSLVAALAEVARDPALRRHAGEVNARAVFESFGARVVLPDLAALYNRAIASAARPKALQVLAKPVVQYGLNVVDSVYDLTRYLRHFTPLGSRTSDPAKLQALIFLQYHKLEKALAMRSALPTAATTVTSLLELLERWMLATDDDTAVVYRGAREALAAYRVRFAQELDADPPLSARLDRHVARCSPPVQPAGGTRMMTSADVADAAAGGFAQLVEFRHSVRAFAADPVPTELLARAVELAQRTPSVCNRQSWRVHAYADPEQRQRVLRSQNGNTYVTSGERHQAYVDGGMFAMSLVYALQSLGLVSCCLNLCKYSWQLRRLRRAAEIPNHEVPVMMVAVGHPPNEFRVAESARLPVEHALVEHRP
jgi:nitroreductase